MPWSVIVWEEKRPSEPDTKGFCLLSMLQILFSLLELFGQPLLNVQYCSDVIRTTLKSGALEVGQRENRISGSQLQESLRVPVWPAKRMAALSA